MSAMHRITVRLTGPTVDHVIDSGMQIAQRVYPGREVVLDETTATKIPQSSNWQFVLHYIAADPIEPTT